jgi:hypothetical protein
LYEKYQKIVQNEGLIENAARVTKISAIAQKEVAERHWEEASKFTATLMAYDGDENA